MYTDFFTKSDTIISHLKSVAQSQQLQFQSDYSGFICIIAVATYEMAIKDIFFELLHNPFKLFLLFPYLWYKIVLIWYRLFRKYN